MIQHKYNARPSVPHKAARKFGQVGLMERFLLPVAVDLRKSCSPIFDQGQIGSCTGNAIAGALEYLELRELKKKSPDREVFDTEMFASVSRLFIYWNERSLEGDTNADSGASLSNGIQAVNRWGICREALWNYNADLLFQKPTEQAYSEAYHHKGIIGYQIDNIGQMKSCLAGGNPFVFGISVWSSFESASVAEVGVVPMPDEYTESQLGGHALLCVGYDDSKQAFIFRNSWGTSWGIAGYGYLPYDYMTDSSLAWDMWTIVK